MAQARQYHELRREVPTTAAAEADRRKLAEIRIERCVYQTLFFSAVMILILVSVRYLEMQNYYITMCKNNPRSD